MPTDTLHLTTGKSQISAIYSGMVAPVEVPLRNVLLDSQLCFYNDLYGWARIVVPALVDRFPPDRISGPTAEGMAPVYTLCFSCFPGVTYSNPTRERIIGQTYYFNCYVINYSALGPTV